MFKFLLPIVLVLIAIAFFVVKSYKIPNYSLPSDHQPLNADSSSPGTDLKLFGSKNLKFAVQLPVDFEVEEKFSGVIIESEGGEIILSRVATNFTELKDYLDDLEKNNKFIIDKRESRDINRMEAVKGIIKSNVNSKIDEKIYFIYSDNWVYSLSTKITVLYSDLDQIAQSFRYTP